MIQWKKTAFKLLVPHQKLAQSVEPTVCHFSHPTPRFFRGIAFERTRALNAPVCCLRTRLATPAFLFSLNMIYSCLPDHTSQGNINRVSTYLAVQIRRTTSVGTHRSPGCESTIRRTRHYMPSVCNALFRSCGFALKSVGTTCGFAADSNGGRKGIHSDQNPNLAFLHAQPFGHLRQNALWHQLGQNSEEGDAGHQAEDEP